MTTELTRRRVPRDDLGLYATLMPWWVRQLGLKDGKGTRREDQPQSPGWRVSSRELRSELGWSEFGSGSHRSSNRVEVWLHSDGRLHEHELSEGYTGGPWNVYCTERAQGWAKNGTLLSLDRGAGSEFRELERGNMTTYVEGAAIHERPFDGIRVALTALLFKHTGSKEIATPRASVSQPSASADPGGSLVAELLLLREDPDARAALVAADTTFGSRGAGEVYPSLSSWWRADPSMQEPVLTLAYLMTVCATEHSPEAGGLGALMWRLDQAGITRVLGRIGRAETFSLRAATTTLKYLLSEATRLSIPVDWSQLLPVLKLWDSGAQQFAWQGEYCRYQETRS